MSEATRLWKQNLESDYHSTRKTIDKTTGEAVFKVKREKGDEWEIVDEWIVEEYAE